MADSTFLGSVYATAEIRTEKVVSGAKEFRDQLNQMESQAAKSGAGIDSSLEKTNENTARSARTIISNLRGIGSAFVEALSAATAPSIAFAAATGLVGRSMIGTAAQLETARQGFVTLLGSAEKADEALAQIKRDAATTPFTLTGLISANQLLTQVTKNAPRSEALLLNVGKALAAAGKGQPELDRIIANLQQIGNTATITEMDVRQFGNSGINILELLADYYGVTKEAAGEMVKDSADAFKDLEGAFAKAGTGSGKFARAYIDQAGTMNQLTSNFIDALNIAGSSIITQSGAFDALKRALAGVIDLITDNTDDVVNFIRGLSGDPGAISTLAGAVVGALVPAFIALGTAFLPLLPFIAAGAAIGALGVLIYRNWGIIAPAFEDIADASGKLWDALKPLTDFIRNTFAPLWGRLLVGQINLLIRSWVFTIEMIAVVIDWFARLVNAIRDFSAFVSGGTIQRTLSEQFNGAVGIIQNFVTDTRSAFETFRSNSQNAFTGLAGSVDTALRPWRDNFLGTLGDTFTAAVNMMWDYDVRTLTIWRDTWVGWGKALSDGVTNLTNQWRTFWGVTLPNGLGADLLNIGATFQAWLQSIPAMFTTGWTNLQTSWRTFWGVTLPDGLGADLLQISANFQTWLESLLTMSMPKWENLGTQSSTSLLQGWSNMEPSMMGRIMETIFKLIGLVLLTIVVGMIDIGIRGAGKLAEFFVSSLQAQLGYIAQAATWVTETVSNVFTEWIPQAYEWGKNLLSTFGDGIKAAIGQMLGKITEALNSARRLLQGNSPPIAGPFKEIDVWGYNVGSAWVEGVSSAVSGLSLDGSVNANLMGIAPAPAPVTQNNSPSFTVQIGMYAGTEIEKRNIAYELSKALEQFEKGRGNL